MNIESKIQKLAAEYHKLIGPEHHKDRDCHWHIDVTWSYGAPARFIVRHKGYLYTELEKECDTYSEALETLRDEIKEAIDLETISQQQERGVTFPDSDIAGELRAAYEL
jgi:hypothetical protein